MGYKRKEGVPAAVSAWMAEMRAKVKPEGLRRTREQAQKAARARWDASKNEGA